MRWSAEEYNEYIGKQKKPSKYRAIKTKVDGITFDSRKEAEYYGTLKFLLRAGEIDGFCIQPRFVLTENSEKATEYRADFIIFRNGGYEIVDVKGLQTSEFKLKMKMLKERYPKLEVKTV